MGSAIGSVLSYREYKDAKKALKRANAKADAEKKNAEALTPAQAMNPEFEEGALSQKKKRGVEATYLASRQTGGQTLGAEA